MKAKAISARAFMSTLSTAGRIQLEEYAVVDSARGGRIVRKFDSREAAEIYRDGIREAGDLQRYRIETL